MKLQCALIFTAAILLSIPAFPANAEEQDKKEKRLKIKWEEVDDIKKYEVQIVDINEKMVLKQTVAGNSIEFILPVGKYRLRIGAINKFDKIETWSDWNEIEIRKSAKSNFFASKFPAEVGFMISGGINYYMLMPTWNNLYRDSFPGFMAVLGFHFGNSKYIAAGGFLKLLGVELEFAYNRFNGKPKLLFNSNLMTINGGLNVFIKSNWDFPLHLYFRVGAGASYSQQKYRRFKYQVPDSGTLLSLDPYAKVGAGFEINFLYALSLSIGADYYCTFYQDSIFMSLRYYAMLGVRI